MSATQDPPGQDQGSSSVDSQLTCQALLVPSSSLRPNKCIYSPFVGRRRRLMKTASMTDEQPSHDWEGGDGPVDSGRA